MTSLYSWTSIRFEGITFGFKATILNVLHSLLTKAGELPDNATVLQALQPHMKSFGKQAKRAMPFAQLVRERFLSNGERTLEVNLELDEQAVLEANREYLVANLGLDADGLEVTSATNNCPSVIPL